MARVKITEAVLGRNSEGFLLGLDGASVQINVAGGSAATVYEDASSGTTITNPVTSDNGRLPGYLNEGRYEQVVTYGGTTYDPVPFEARAGYPTPPASSISILANDGSGTVSWEDTNSIVGAAPWQIDINVFMPPATNVNWTGFSTGSMIMGCYRLSSGAQNDEIGWDVVLAKGTWTISLLHAKANNAGIYTVSLDGVTVDTIDAYASATTYDNVSSISGYDVASTGRKRLLLKMATKNASSAGYYGYLQSVSLRRTA